MYIFVFVALCVCAPCCMSNICILFHCACIACTLAYALALLAIFFSLFLHFSTKLIHTIPLHAPTLEGYRFIQRPLAVWLWVLLQWFFAFQILLAINFQWFLLQHCCSGILSHTHTQTRIYNHTNTHSNLFMCANMFAFTFWKRFRDFILDSLCYFTFRCRHMCVKCRKWASK